MALDQLLHTLEKDTEVAMLFVRSTITISVMYYSIKQGYKIDDSSKGFFELLESWLVTIIFLRICLVFLMIHQNNFINIIKKK